MVVTRPALSREESSLEMRGISFGERELVKIIFLLSFARASRV
jgi:hypothetical protein